MNELHERISIRLIGGTRRTVKKLLKSFPRKWENEGHFYRAAIFRYCNELQAEILERDIEKAHERRLRRSR